MCAPQSSRARCQRVSRDSCKLLQMVDLCKGAATDLVIDMGFVIEGKKEVCGHIVVVVKHVRRNFQSECLGLCESRIVICMP